MIRIAESTPDRIVLSRREAGSTVFMLAFFCVWTPFWIMPTLTIAAQAIAPAWAERHGIDDDVPLVAAAITLAIFLFGAGMIALLVRNLLFHTTMTLSADLAQNRLTITSRGLFRCPDRVLPLSEAQMAIVTTAPEDPGDEELAHLSVTVVKTAGATRRQELWATLLENESLALTQRRVLEDFIARAQAAPPLPA